MRIIVFLALILGSVSGFAARGDDAPHLKPIVDQEIVDYLYNKAERISGIPGFPKSERPSLYSSSKEDLNKTVCPEDPKNCRNLAAVFDDIGYRIIVREDLNVTESFTPFDYSFVIHEIVHALQYRQRGAEIFNGCAAVYETERQAYAVQDEYLKEEGDFFRASMALRGFYCDEDIANADYLKSKAVWDRRASSETWAP